MQNTHFIKLIKNFVACKSGETAVQITLIFSVAVILGSLFAAPFLNNASRDYAYQKQFGVDSIQTSSTGTKKQEVKRYTVRKSVLDAAE